MVKKKKHSRNFAPKMADINEIAVTYRQHLARLPKHNTRTDYTKRLAMLERWCSMHGITRVEEIDFLQFLDWVFYDRGVSPRTLNNYRTWLRSFISWMHSPANVAMLMPPAAVPVCSLSVIMPKRDISCRSSSLQIAQHQTSHVLTDAVIGITTRMMVCCAYAILVQVAADPRAYTSIYRVNVLYSVHGSKSLESIKVLIYTVPTFCAGYSGKHILLTCWRPPDFNDGTWKSRSNVRKCSLSTSSKRG